MLIILCSSSVNSFQGFAQCKHDSNNYKIGNIKRRFVFYVVLERLDTGKCQMTSAQFLFSPSVDLFPTLRMADTGIRLRTDISGSPGPAQNLSLRKPLWPRSMDNAQTNPQVTGSLFFQWEMVGIVSEGNNSLLLFPGALLQHPTWRFLGGVPLYGFPGWQDMHPWSLEGWQGTGNIPHFTRSKELTWCPWASG